MNCENDYCIYNGEGACALKRVDINSLGMCDDCIMISLDEDFLKSEKSRQLDKLEARWVEIEASSDGRATFKQK